MRLIGICLLCFFVTISYYYSISAAETSPDNTIRNYFTACKNGDIEAIKQIITGSFYDKRKVLLNRNPDYSKFLAQHFDAVEISLIS